MSQGGYSKVFPFCSFDRARLFLLDFFFYISFAVSVEDLACVFVRDDVGELAIYGTSRHASLLCVLIDVSFIYRRVLHFFCSVFVRRTEVIRTRT